MGEQNLHKGTILPISNETMLPLWSVMIPTYNCAHYLRKTLTSVLEQDPGADIMQIEVIDDHSTKDNPKAVVEELGKGRVSFYQQAQNVGYIKNFETCLQRAQGKLVHLLHGDDLILHGFYRKLQKGFDTYPEIGAAFCRHIYIDENDNWLALSPLEQSKSGILSNWLEKIALGQRIQTPSIVVRREVYEKLGGFDRRMTCWGEDWEMWVRIATNYPFWYESEPLALYRNSSTSLTGQSKRTGRNIQDFRMAIEITKEYLPESLLSNLPNQALRGLAFYCLNCAADYIQQNDYEATKNLLSEALICTNDSDVARHVVKLRTKVFYKKTLNIFWQYYRRLFPVC
jgi:glycosyltransferase involved in cell wall biosynthesis